MTLVTSVAIYFIIWWMTLFVILPIGVCRIPRSRKATIPGAWRSRMLFKVAVNTVLAGVVWTIAHAIIELDLITLNDLGVSR